MATARFVSESCEYFLLCHVIVLVDCSVQTIEIFDRSRACSDERLRKKHILRLF